MGRFLCRQIPPMASVSIVSIVAIASFSGCSTNNKGGTSERPVSDHGLHFYGQKRSEASRESKDATASGEETTGGQETLFSKTLAGISPKLARRRNFYLLIDQSAGRDERRDRLWQDDVIRRIENWYGAAPVGSHAEAFRTSPVHQAWNPSPLFEVTIPSTGKAARQKGARAIGLCLSGYFEKTPTPAGLGSAWLEDVRRICERASLADCPYTITIVTDWAQSGPTLRYGKVLRATNVNPLQRAVLAATGGPLKHPPEQVEIVFLPPDPRGGAGLTSPDASKLQDFFVGLFGRDGWGAGRVTVVEPRHAL